MTPQLSLTHEIYCVSDNCGVMFFSCLTLESDCYVNISLLCDNRSHELVTLEISCSSPV